MMNYLFIIYPIGCIYDMKIIDVDCFIFAIGLRPVGWELVCLKSSQLCVYKKVLLDVCVCLYEKNWFLINRRPL